MMATDHDGRRESIGLYVLDALEPAERAAIEAHLAECAECAAEARTLSGVAEALLYGVPQLDPPAALRTRVLSGIPSSAGGSAEASGSASTTAGRAQLSGAGTPASTRGSASTAGSQEGTISAARRPAGGLGRWTSGLAIAALVLLAVGLGLYGVSMRQRVDALEVELREATNRRNRTEQQLEVATRAAAGVQLRMAVLTAPDLRQVNLAGQNPAAPGAAGRGFWSGTRGLVFAATELPPVPAGRTYQLWYLTASAPVSAGLFTPDPNGAMAGTFDAPPAGRPPTGLAVSLEPEGGVPLPTGAIYLAGTTTTQ